MMNKESSWDKIRPMMNSYYLQWVTNFFCKLGVDHPDDVANRFIDEESTMMQRFMNLPTDNTSWVYHERRNPLRLRGEVLESMKTYRIFEIAEIVSPANSDETCTHVRDLSTGQGACMYHGQTKNHDTVKAGLSYLESRKINVSGIATISARPDFDYAVSSDLDTPIV